MDLSKEVFINLPNEYKALAIKLNILGAIKIDFGGNKNGK